MSTLVESLGVPHRPLDTLDERLFDFHDRFWELLPAAAYICDAGGTIRRFNRRAAELWGRTPALGDPAERYCGSLRLYRLDGGLLPHAQCPMADVLRTGIPVRDQEIAIERPDGSRLIALVNIDPIRDGAGTVVGAINCFQDITARKRAESELRASRQDLEDFFENSVVPMHWLGADGTILRANRAELDLLGYAREEYVGRCIAEFYADSATIQDILARLSAGDRLEQYPARLRAKDGSIKHVVISCSARFQNGEFVGTRCVTLDMTAYRSSQAALRDSERRFRELLGALPAAVYTTDAQGRITYYNEAAVEFSGRRPALGSDSWCVTWRLYWPDGTPMRHEECPMAVALKEGRPVRGEEAIAERPDGSRVPFMPYPTPLYDESGELVGAVNMLVDITEQKRAAEEHDLLLREMSHRVKNLFTVASGLVALSARFAHTPDDVVNGVRQRMRALAVAHDLARPGLTDAGEKGYENTTLDALARAIFAPYVAPEQGKEPECVSLSGPDVPVGGKAVASLALILHEFTTNAAKYGALSCRDGRIRVDWSIARDQLVLTWREQNGPSLSEPPKERGFGSFFAERTVTSQFDGRLSRDWAPEGLTIHLLVPLARLAH